MNGGFPLSFASSPSRLTEVAAAFDLLRLSAAAELIRAGIDLVPGSAEADSEIRAGLVDTLPESAAIRLEDLGDRYSALVSDTLIGDRIEAYAASRQRRPRLPRSVPEMLDEYVETLLESDAAAKASQIAKANRLFHRNHKLSKYLRETSEGREGIWALRDHDHPQVRQSAVADSLAWRPDEAVRLLEEMEAAGAFEAKYILQEWRAGKLNLDR
jgi:hypothetical protein